MAKREFYRPLQRHRSSVTLSPKHGVNPSCGVCFWCGEEDGTVALCGLTSRVNEQGDRIGHDAKAPRRMCFGYNPCPECAKAREGKIFFFEATHGPNENDLGPIDEGIYPTGNWAVVTENGVRWLLKPEEMVEQVLKAGVCALESDAWEKLEKAGEPLSKAPDKT